MQSPITNARPDRPGADRRWSLHFLLALVLGGLFIYAGVLKAWDPVKFAGDIANFRLLPWTLGVRLAFYLPWLEIICGIALIGGWLRTGALGLLTALMLVFIAATVSAEVRGIDLDCGCFGAATQGLTFASHMAIDLALLVGLVALWFWPQPRVH